MLIKEMKAEEKLKAIEALIEQGKTLQEIAKEAGYAKKSNVKDFLKTKGYKFEGDSIVKLEQVHEQQESNTECNTECNTLTVMETNPLVINPKIVEILEQEQDTLVNMLEWYKQYSNICNTSNTVIKIELPNSENTMISTRSNKAVWEQFKVFAKNNSANFKMGDLVAQALKEFMEKYK